MVFCVEGESQQDGFIMMTAMKIKYYLALHLIEPIN